MSEELGNESSRRLRYVLQVPPSGANFGDFITTYAARTIIRSQLGIESTTCSPRNSDFPQGAYDCLIIPGITHLTSNAGARLHRVKDIPYPVWCLAGNIWVPEPHPGYLFGSRILGGNCYNEVDLSIAQLMKKPVGARDRFTFDILKKNGIDALYTGCPTLQLPNEPVADDGYILFSIGRGHYRAQTHAAKRLARTKNVIGITHDKGSRAKLKAAGWDLPIVSFDGNVELYLSYFRRASLVVTGRLHGALPAVAFGKRVFYFGTRDSRTTILDDLGVTIHTYRELLYSVDRASVVHNAFVLHYFRENWKKLLDHIIQDTERRH